MAYATISDVEARYQGLLDADQKAVCEALLDDVAVLIDAYNKNASDEAKKVVSCRVIIRAIGDTSGAPIGSSQGSMSALGYSQSWTMPSSGASGQIYLDSSDKNMLGRPNKIGASNPFVHLGGCLND